MNLWRNFLKSRIKTVSFRLGIFGLVAMLNINTLAIADNNDYRDVKWQDLLAHTPPPAQLPGKNTRYSLTADPWAGLADQVNDAVKQSLDAQASEAQHAASQGRADFDGQKIKLSGFIVPLEDSPDQAVTEFFLVPYVGACIHVPPPPPDQIVYVKYPHGIKIENIYDAYTVQGTLHTQASHSGLAQTAYTLDADRVVDYGGT